MCAPNLTFNEALKKPLTRFSVLVLRGSALLENAAFEKFSMYKFSIDYPEVCSIQFNPKGKRERGDLLFLFPDKEKIYLTWGELERAQTKFPTANDQADHSFAVMKKSGTVKDVETLSQDSLTINSHQAAYRRVRLEEKAAGLLSANKAIPHEGHSLHLHCDRTSRYFAIYTMLSSKAPEDFGELFKWMVNSFKCH